MELIEINKNSNLINKIEKIYLSSFPADERMEFKDILDRKAPNSELFALCNDNKLVGFTFISSFGNFAYIIYLAIDECERNKKYGSMALKLIDKKYKGKTKVLCVEKPLKKDDLKSKRIGFYKRNGFHLADFEFNYLGRVYYSMFSGNFDKEKFMELLLICFPGCRNFNNILDFDE